jgi:hypothetical protein
MNFKEATDAVCSGLGHEEVATTLGVSVQSVRQARLNYGNAKRPPPKGWQRAVIRLAERRILYYRKLIEELRAEAT